MPARYRVRLRGRTFTVWDNDAQRAAETAHEWLDASDKAGIRPDAKAEVEQIGESLESDDLLGTQRASNPDYRVEVVERGTNRPGRRAAGPADSALD